MSVTVYRCTVGEIANQHESLMLRDHVPTWVLDVVQHNQFPKFNKIPFILQSHSSVVTKVIKRSVRFLLELIFVFKKKIY